MLQQNGLINPSIVNPGRNTSSQICFYFLRKRNIFVKEIIYGGSFHIKIPSLCFLSSTFLLRPIYRKKKQKHCPKEVVVVVVEEEREVHISLTHLFLIPRLITPDRARRGSEDVQPHIELQQKKQSRAECHKIHSDWVDFFLPTFGSETAILSVTALFLFVLQN